jgi:hypothetical protein
MKHLLSYSVYERLSDLVPMMDAISFLGSIGCDGLELLTGYGEVPGEFRGTAPAVHLPYATDWIRGWRGRDTSFVPDDDYARFMFYGRSRESVLDNLEVAVRVSEPLRPAYGVLHAGSVDVDEVQCTGHEQTDEEVRAAFVEMADSLARRFGGEPPFTLVFENLWWPGVKYLGPEDYEYISDNIGFDDWGICVDTGHIMNAWGDSTDEADSIRRLSAVFSGYPRAMKDRIKVVHAHKSLSGDLVKELEDRRRAPGESFDQYMTGAYARVSILDEHRPFSLRAAAAAVASLHPDYVTHEMMSPDIGVKLAHFSAQRSLFD